MRVRLGHVVFSSLIPAYCWIALLFHLQEKARKETQRELERERKEIRECSLLASPPRPPTLLSSRASLEDTNILGPFPLDDLEEGTRFLRLFLLSPSRAATL